MQLLCNGVYLDLPSNAKFSLKRQNNVFAFAFEEMSTNRTTEITLPATTTNNRVFGLSGMPETYGTGMRRVFDAELIDGVIVNKGKLYVTKYSVKDKQYSAVFTFGELLTFKAVKEAGKIAKYADDTTTPLDYEVSADTINTPYPFNCVKYRQGNAERLVSPSVSAKYIIANCAAQLGIQINTPAVCDYLRIVAPLPQPMQEEIVHFTNEAYNPLPVKDGGTPSLANLLQADCTLLEAVEYSFVTYAELNSATHDVAKDWEYLLGVIYTHQDLTFTFPDDFPEDVFLIKFNRGQSVPGAVEFLGDYSFTKSLNFDESYNHETGECITTDDCHVSGESLAGRSVDIPTRSYIMFVTPRDYVYALNDTERFVKDDWAFTQFNYNRQIRVVGTSDEMLSNEDVRLKDNLPDIDLVELLKSVAVLSGTVLRYNEQNGVTFDPVNYEQYQFIDLTPKIISIKEMERNYNGWSKMNLYRFKEDSLVPSYLNIMQPYAIDSDFISDENTLYEIPFSCASQITEGDEQRAFVANDKEDAKEFMLMVVNGHPGDIYMHRVSIPEVDAISKLCEESTTIQVSASMNPLEYGLLKEDSLVIINGTRYIWIDSTYSNGVAELRLAKI